MPHIHFPSRRRAHRRNRNNLFVAAAFTAALLGPVGYLNLASRTDAQPAVSNGTPVPPRAEETPAAASVTVHDRALVDPTPILKAEALTFALNAPIDTRLKPFAMQREDGHAAPAPSVAAVPVETPPVTVAEAPEPVPAPLPVPRPRDLGASKPSVPPRVASSAPVSQPPPAQPAAPEDNRTFFEKLLGVKPASPPSSALGYAALDRGTGSIAPRARFGTTPAPQAGTAVYDISAKVVYMPNGERLEAHSGLGEKMDDPRFVHVRMQGATPPGTYILTEREALFHGVRALRMNPVGGSAAIHGRDGILAHTYLLGPRGDSNGCISFKDYDRFLQAYLRGEVKRVVVVPGRGQDLLPRIVNNPAIQPARDT